MRLPPQIVVILLTTLIAGCGGAGGQADDADALDLSGLRTDLAELRDGLDGRTTAVDRGCPVLDTDAVQVVADAIGIGAIREEVTSYNAFVHPEEGLVNVLCFFEDDTRTGLTVLLALVAEDDPVAVINAIEQRNDPLATATLDADLDVRGLPSGTVLRMREGSWTRGVSVVADGVQLGVSNAFQDHDLAGMTAAIRELVGIVGGRQ